MSNRSSSRPRELRRRINLRARLHADAKWSDASIINISSRGMMIDAPGSGGTGSRVELWLGRKPIVATVVWRKGTHAGLSADDFISVDDLLASDAGPSLHLTAEGWPATERRARPRRPEESREAGRWMEFCAIALIALGLSLGALGLVAQAFARPLASIQQVLG